MAVDIHQLIAAISPDTYCDKSVRSEVKKLVKEKGYLEAAEKAKLVEWEFMDLDKILYEGGAFSFKAIKNPLEKHTIIYDFPGGSLEPVYFWILDYVNSRYGESYKLSDNFIATAGSAHFAEMGGRATRMQEEAIRLLGNVNQVIKSIINIIYDLKEFNMRLDLYDKYYSNKPEEKNEALLGLKQIWMDSVDAKRGNSSIKGLAQQFDYVTIIDAFMTAKTLEDVSKTPKEGGLDLNERVRRILQHRVGDFFRWLSESEKELRKRFEIEKKYLRSQVNSVKLYSRWIKPYLEAAKKLEQHAEGGVELVTAFNTTIMELKVMGIKDYNILKDVNLGDLPEAIRNQVLDKKIRKYAAIAIVEFRFISIPERAQQGGYGFRGKVELNFTAYSLNSDEIKVLKEQVEKNDFGDLLELIAGTTDESLAQLQEDIDEFLSKKEDKEEKKENEDINPFSALFSFLKKEKKKDAKKDLSHGIPPDTEYEKAIRNQAIIDARKELRIFYEVFKGSYGMPNF